MARIKIKRHDVIVDMTPFVDVAFLILTFFILTAQFKKSDVQNITTPKSISSATLGDQDLMTVSITKDGKFYFTPTQSPTGRKQLLELMSKKYKIPFTVAEQNSFAIAPFIGAPMAQLPAYLHLSKEQMDKATNISVPMDKTNKQLIDWIKFSLQVNPDSKLAIKGDKDAQYPEFKELFESLRDIEFYKFNLITMQK